MAKVISGVVGENCSALHCSFNEPDINILLWYKKNYNQKDILQLPGRPMCPGSFLFIVDIDVDRKFFCQLERRVSQ